MKGRSFLTNQIYDKMACLVEEVKAADVVYCNYSKTYDTASYSILLVNVAAQSLDKYTVDRGKNWLDGRAKESRWMELNSVGDRGYQWHSPGLILGVSFV